MKRFKREWVKTAAIIFLAVLLALTFFSNTIMNLSLPEVVTANTSSGAITNAIRGQAAAQANNSYDINVTSPRHVLAVHVRDGQEVQEGDLLFELEESDDDPLAQAMDELNALHLAYQMKLLDVGADYTMQNETIRQAREDLQQATAERAALGTTNLTETAAQARVTELMATLRARESQLDQLEAELTFIDTFDSRSTRIAQQVIAYESALADFIREMGMSYENFIEENTTVSNQWTQAVERTKLAMQTAAAAARVAVVQEISAQVVQVTASQNALTEAQSVLERVRAINDADRDVRIAQRALNAALIALSSEQQLGSAAEAKRLLELQAMADEITELEERIERMEAGLEGDGNSILARYDGIIAGITVVAGQTAEPGLPLARIEVAEMGFLAELTVDSRQAQEIRPGAEVDVTSASWMPVTGRVSGFRADPEDPTNRRIVMIDLQGEVTIGEQLNLSIQISRANYEVIVPRSAISQDATSPHVYVLQSRTSPLGTRYFAVRTDVTILAEDEQQVAVSGLDRFSSVIIRSSDTLSDRAAVRLAPN
ncbi:MAG: HlyD family efflux transporter periplasmic adaptor subunit [Oscillospiraceae bacterium]|nr:HlyD family efflux transporter periplasmic adaptor subunit [Oscillospiraceae bacterium]